MEEITGNSWFWWAIAVAVGAPLLIVILGELHGFLRRRGNALAKPVALLRNVGVPVGALFVLLTEAASLSSARVGTQILATVLGFLVIIVVLSTVNAAVFGNAAHGTWRQKLPGIFVDMGRIVLISIGLALLFSWVWGANIGGLFAALGVGSIVIGLAMQNAVGGIISGLLLLFEQPFALGDWLRHGSGVAATTGRVIEVNWRAVHIDTGNGLQIIPNATLAGGAFTNLSRPARDHVEDIETSFAVDDPPEVVVATLNGVARDVPHLKPGTEPRTRSQGGGKYTTSLHVMTYADVGAGKEAFRNRTWYATRRAGLSMEGGSPDAAVANEDVEAALRKVAPTLHLDDAEVSALAPVVHLERFGDGEVVLRQGDLGDVLRFIISGRVKLVMTSDGASVSLGTNESGDYLGQSVLTREPSQVTAIAVGPITTLPVAKSIVEDLLRVKSGLAHEMDEIIAARRELAKKAGTEGKLPRARGSNGRTPNLEGSSSP